jgi:hypothetical protein
MRHLNLALIVFLSSVLGILVGPFTIWAQQPQPQTAQTAACPSPGPFWVVFWIVTILLFVLLMVTFLGLSRHKDWSLADAISEEAGNQPTTLPVGQKPIMVASSSRLVALLGLLGILSMFIGVGYYVLWALFCTGTVPQLWEIMRFFYAGAAMFAPYLVNQIKEAFSSLAPPR